MENENNHNKTTFFSKVKLVAMRNPECTIFHHLPQRPPAVGACVALQPNFSFYF